MKINMYSMSQKSSFLTCGFVIAVIVFISSFSLIMPMKAAFGDGLFMEQLSASFGNRKADLLIKMTPPVVTTETLQTQNQKPVIQFKLFDSNTNQGIKHVTYFITIEKNGKKILADTFHDHNGDLRLLIRPKNTSLVTVYGEPDPILSAYTGTENSPVVAQGPIFLQGGLYHFIVRIETVDFDRTILPEDKQPVFDGWLSIGDTDEKQIIIHGKQLPVQIISYYDKLNGFKFDQTKMQMNFTMPFDWNTTRLEKNRVLVHEEVHIPKPSELTAKRAYIGQINGIDVTQNLVLDDTNPQKDVIHFMIPKPQVIQIAEKVNNEIRQTSSSSSSSPSSSVSSQPMIFTLQPSATGVAGASTSINNSTSSSNNQTSQQANNNSSNSNTSANSTSAATTTTKTVVATSSSSSPPMEKLTDGNTYKIKMSWSPANIQAKNTTTFNIEFLDPKSNQKIKNNVQYDFMIMPAENPDTMLTHRAAKIAQNGSAQQSFSFKDDNIGSVMVRVSNINNSGEYADFPITVTPEFPFAAVIQMAIASGLIVSIAIFTKRKSANMGNNNRTTLP
jgi:hypothetical protein